MLLFLHIIEYDLSWNYTHVCRVAFFAGRDIEPYEELTYDYSYEIGAVAGKEVICMCGAKHCKGRLL